MIKKLLFATLLMFSAFGAIAQLKNPVKWSYSAKKINATTYEVHLKATIDPGWHIYTLDHSSDIGIATSVSFTKNPLAEQSGPVKAVGKAVKLKDPSTGEMVQFYENTIDLVQVVKLKSAVKTSIAGTLEFMACDDKQCLPPKEQSFSVSLQ
jgi:thiol:disulfide interchange protein DsbD